MSRLPRVLSAPPRGAFLIAALALLPTPPAAAQLISASYVGDASPTRSITGLALLQEIVSGQHKRLGDAILAAQAVYANNGAFPELLSIYHLLGDPALEIQ